MSISRNALDESALDLRRFTEDSGDPINCWKVIEMILQPFNCVLKQHKGKYTITNFHELNSPIWEFDWDTLTENGSFNPVNENVINVQNFKFRGTYIEQQKVKPIKAVNITLYNKDLQENVTGRNLANWYTAWNKSFYSWSAVRYDPLLPNLPYDLMVYSNNSNNNAGQSNVLQLNRPFSLAKQTEGDYIMISFDYILEYVSNTHQSSGGVMLKIEIQKPNGTWVQADLIPVYYQYWTTYTSTEKIGYKIEESGNYNVRFSWVPDPQYSWTANPLSWTAMQSRIKNIQITRSQKATYDRGFYQSLNTNSRKEYKPELFVGDAYQITYLGGLLKYDASTQTWLVCEKWNSYQGTEEIKLLDIYARNILNNKARYKNFLRVEIVDREFQIDMNSIIVIDGRYYVWLTCNRKYRQGTIQGDLLELIVEKQTYQPILEKILKTVNGQEQTD